MLLHSRTSNSLFGHARFLLFIAQRLDYRIVLFHPDNKHFIVFLLQFNSSLNILLIEVFIYLNSMRTLRSFFNVRFKFQDSWLSSSWPYNRCHAFHILLSCWLVRVWLAGEQNASFKQLSGIFLLVWCHRGCSKCCPKGFSDSSFCWAFSKEFFWINFPKVLKLFGGLPFNRNDCPAK